MSAVTACSVVDNCSGETYVGVPLGNKCVGIITLRNKVKSQVATWLPNVWTCLTRRPLCMRVGR